MRDPTCSQDPEEQSDGQKDCQKGELSQARDKVIQVELTANEQALVNLTAARCQQNMKGFTRAAVLC
jgi:hypothetical protein